jgi:hypothetical protein
MWTVVREADHGRRMRSHSVRVWWSGVQVQFLTKTIGPLGTRRAATSGTVANPVARRRAIVDLYVEGWSAKAIAG